MSTTDAIANATLGRLRAVIYQPTPADFTAGLRALYRWAEQPARIVEVTATLTALITDTAQLLGDQALWIGDAYSGVGSCAPTEAVLEILEVSEGGGDYSAFVPRLLDNTVLDGITLEQLLLDLLLLTVVMRVLYEF